MSTARIADEIRDAGESRRALRIRGAGTWMAAGQPVKSEATISLSDDRGIVEYVPGDLTLTARAGTRLTEISAATRAQHQWLPLDPWGGDEGTLGATVSTGTAGPHAFSMGSPRDVVLGLEFVGGTGQVVRSGGRVVKNVAGFDITRLIVGSWGTLGVITEVTVRLRARPPQTRTLAIAAPTNEGELNDLAARIRAWPFTPLAAELINPALASALGHPPRQTLLLRLGGNAKSVQGQTDIARGLGDAVVCDESVWDQLRVADGASAATWRWSQLPSLFGRTWFAAQHETRELERALMHGQPLRGIVRVACGGEPAALGRAAASYAGGTAIVERLPMGAWSQALARAADDRLSQGIRRKFDPGGVLNPGILGEVA